jgi:CRISPR-associated endonuclease/helicase Cas3
MSVPPLPTFEAMFRAAWGNDPYPWQRRLAAQVCEDGRWPDAVGVPTGAGKTASLDVAVYALAADADRPPAERRAPRRVVMVVDRRTIVDQSFDRAVKLRDALMAATDGPLAAIRARLLSLMGPDAQDEEPLAVALLRGGLPGDDGWARRPDQPLIAVSTVDQVGSRLLFRGYGVRPTMQPIHAGLLGHDVLLLLDEVHLSRPFEETLTAIGDQWRGWRTEAGLPDRWQVVRLSATSGHGAVFDLDDHDRANVHLAKRLTAAKPVRLVATSVATHGGKPAAPTVGWVSALEAEAKALVQAGRRSVGVVVNRVDTARELAKRLAKSAAFDVQLVTGRMRPCDRDAVMLTVADRAGPDWQERHKGGRPFLCVATQAIEAGADLDFDGLVTEVASIDAIVQRFGRANRTGAHAHAQVVVVAPKGVADLDDPIYGASLGPTWAWLKAHEAELDVGPASLKHTLPDAPAACWPPRTAAAVLLPAHLDLLSQTGPVPRPDPEPALYLHGLNPPRPEVQIVWRADLTAELLAEADASEGARASLAAHLAAVPPTAFEALSLPVAAARRWLAGERTEGTYGDAGAAPDEDPPGRPSSPGAVVAVLLGADGVVLVRANGLAPGRVYLVPAELGGLADGSFDPADPSPVADRGDLGRTVQSGRVVLRLDPRVHGVRDPVDGAWRWRPGVPPIPGPPDDAARSLRVCVAEVRTWLRAVASVEGDLGVLAGLAGPRPAVHRSGDVWVVTGRRRLRRPALLALAGGRALSAGDDALTGDDRSSYTGAAVGLDDHLRGVARWAGGFAAACGVSAKLAHDLALAGRWHDLGKADPRFQVMLHDGDEITAAGAPLRAKSDGALNDPASRARARKRAALPEGFRHEMASVALLRSEAGQTLLASAHDPELVLHLVASHHGHARPFAPPEVHLHNPKVSVSIDGVTLTADGDHGQDALDSGVAARFWSLQRRYGWWGLAWLEAVLRLADHRESEATAASAQEAT